MRRPDPQAGFTLVEVLAALVVTAAFVAVVLPFAGRLVSRWWIGEMGVETADGWMQGIARLSDDLSQAVPISVRQGEAKVASFAAGPDFVQFVRPALGSSAAMQLETVRFEIEASRAGYALVRRAGRYRVGDPAQLGSPTTILDGANRLRFRAYGKDLVPRPTWINDANMPAGVELTATGSKPGLSPPSPVLLPVVARSHEKASVAIAPTPTVSP